MMASSAPRGHRDPEYVAAKLSRLDDPHVAPVQDLVREIRATLGIDDVPYADPTSGGVASRVLFVLEAPAAAAAHRSTMLSPDNDDGTAANVWRLYQASGLRRDHCLHWNAVPWYIGDGTRIRAAASADVRDGLTWLARLIRLLPDLRLVIAMGAAARDGVARYLLRDDARLLHWLAVPHPSQRVINTNPGAWASLEAAFRIARHVSEDTQPRARNTSTPLSVTETP